MLTRTISSVVLFPIFVTAVLLGGIYLKLGILFLSLVGMFEFYRCINKTVKPINYLGFILATFYIVMLGHEDFHKYTIAGFLIVIVMLMTFMFINHEKYNINDVAITLFAFFYIAFMFSNVYFIRYQKYGIYNVWLPFICAWGCDTGAYFVGLKFGKNKLAPILSPKKTIEGSIGGVLLSVCLSLMYCRYLSVTAQDFAKHLNHMYVTYFFIGVLGAVFAQFGDLFASSIKRYTNIKDYGKIIPGHGGVLDRFDSVIFTSSIIYLFGMFLF